MASKKKIISTDSNILSIQGLLPHLSEDTYADKIHIYKSLESTNKTAKEMAIQGCEHGTVILSDTQTAGKGRYGRTFYSPSQTGLYMSFILRSELFQISQITLITAATSVAVCRAIQSVIGKEAKIKWVNDILLDHKKICGILTEAISNLESSSIDWVVVGIGINVNTSIFPNELQNTAGSLLPSVADGSIRTKLAAEIINTIFSSHAWVEEEDVYAEYKARMEMLGKVVKVIEADKTYDALALDVDKKGQLVVETMNGQRTVLSSGEVSLLLK